uniref:Uncharacterized protein n=1 Tax=Hyaloperonospora arabidopsidis (strain Emoy2) TaxID=559515 RepID=M4B898_HYAAE
MEPTIMKEGYKGCVQDVHTSQSSPISRHISKNSNGANEVGSLLDGMRTRRVQTA